MNYEVIDAHVYPNGQLDVLSKIEVSRLLDTSQGGLYRLFRNSSLAVLNCGNPLNDGKELLEKYKSFDPIRICLFCTNRIMFFPYNMTNLIQ